MRKIIIYSLIGLISLSVINLISERTVEALKIKHVQEIAPVQVARARANYYHWTGKHPLSMEDLASVTVGINTKDRLDHGPWLTEEEYIDPWGTPYKYDSKLLILISAGPDKIFDTSDDKQVKIMTN